MPLLRQLSVLKTSHDACVAKWKQSIDRAVKAGSRLEPAARQLETAGTNAKVPQ